MKPSNDVAENRRTFVHSLKTNELGLKQTHSSNLRDRDGSVCALGYACHLFDLDMRYDPDDEQGPYDHLMVILGLREAAVHAEANNESLDYVWKLNDRDELSFEDIGEHLEIVWGLQWQ